MINTLAFFPLGLVVFPGEPLNLHIFEPRYKQLIKDCKEKNITFGIPPYIDDSIKSYGTEVRLINIVNQYEDGRMDIATEALNVFKWKSFNNPMEGKLYAGGEVEYFEDKDDSNVSERILLLETAQKFFKLLKIDIEIDVNQKYLSYFLGHKIGLGLSQEYNLITLRSEKQRIEVLIDHLTRSIPVIKESENSKDKIKMNGHFKHFDPLKF
ncbi:MAG: LON peptidase substrate-binding domain-containing protein [Bacteroidota bacterium]